MVDIFIRAAEAWGRNRYGQEARACACAEPVQHPDGMTTVDVDLRLESSPAESAGKGVLVQCLVTLEPDGSISCYQKGG